MEEISARQKELLEIIYKFIKNSGFPPSFEEMKEELNVSSNQSILDLLKQLEKKKFIKRNSQAARAVTILPQGFKILAKRSLVPVLGSASAGFPISALEQIADWKPINDELAKLNDDVFILKVNGDSMINAGIDDGDMVLVKKENEFVTRDIVYARIGNDVTIKRFISQNKPPYVYLKPENPKYKIILCSDEVTLEGKVIFVFKK